MRTGFFLLISLWAGCAAAQEYARERLPDLLTWDELRVLGEQDPPPPELAAKAAALSKTPFVNNEAWFRGVRASGVDAPRLGRSLRLMLWNVERGLRLDEITTMYTDTKKFLANADLEDAVQGAELADHIAALRKADIVILNELDWGLKRTGYREVVRELGAALDMNWAYAVEFFEVDPVRLGTEKFAGLDDTEAEESARLRAELVVDQARYKGLHGTAILSRYPIREATARPFNTIGYDWYGAEKDKVSRVEKGKRLASEKLFLETILREIRRGGRTVLTVTLDVPDAPGGSITVVAPHLENRCKPAKRLEQFRELMAHLKGAANTVVVAGDLNTSMTDAQPTTLRREFYKRVGSAEFWATRGLKWATGLGLAYDIVAGGVNTLKNLNDPTAKHIPIVAPNPEAELFEYLEKVRFDDGGRFDFRGDRTRSGGRDGTLANSNQRAEKGFVPTYSLTRTYGPIGQFKLDWFFVKVPAGNGFRFAPHFPRTYQKLNHSYADRLSDHSPITVDLPFNEPTL
ncbi:MAG: endonuclease/exonuclease/phosphatase family protein [Bryobacteraceae bacterium]